MTTRDTVHDVAPAGSAPSTDLPVASAGVAAVLEEVAGRLEDLVNDDRAGAIDLRSLPMTPNDLAALKNVLGRGEVSATVEAMGTSEVYETACPGVWWARHANARGETVAEAIEITRVPTFLTVQDGDLEHGISALRARTDELLEAARAPLGDT